MSEDDVSRVELKIWSIVDKKEIEAFLGTQIEISWNIYKKIISLISEYFLKNFPSIRWNYSHWEKVLSLSRENEMYKVWSTKRPIDQNDDLKNIAPTMKSFTEKYSNSKTIGKFYWSSINKISNEDWNFIIYTWLIRRKGEKDIVVNHIFTLDDKWNVKDYVKEFVI